MDLGRFVYCGNKNRRSIELFRVFFFGGMLSFVVGMSTYEILNFRHLWIPACLMTSLIAIILYTHATKNGSSPRIFILLIIAATNGFGVTISLNRIIDFHSTQLYTTDIRNRSSYNDGKYTSHDLEIGPYGPITDTSRIDVES